MNSILFILPFLLTYTIFVVYAERKISAFIQNRLGPMEVGYYGVLQTVADLLKLLQKENITPLAASFRLFQFAPVFIFASVFAGLSVIPVGPDWVGAEFSSALFFLLAIISLDIVGILMAGFSSGNKYSTLGSIRSVAQIISYEIPLGLAVLTVIFYCGTLDLQGIIQMQASENVVHFLGINHFKLSGVGGFLSWNIFQMPILIPVWIIFFICSLAESNRAPFDLPEAESEIVAGFHTEYSGFQWAVIMLAEYAMMLLTSLLGVILFFGGWGSSFLNIGELRLYDLTMGPVWGAFWLYLKALFFVSLQIWVRWTFPRVRINQLLTVSWKYLIPFMIICLLVTGIWKLILTYSDDLV